MYNSSYFQESYHQHTYPQSDHLDQLTQYRHHGSASVVQPRGLRTSPNLPRLPTRTIQSYTMASPEELAELQKLSNEYQADLPGPLVGPRLNTEALTAEFSAADPIYIQKTQALPESYSQYRTVKGDGNCGWRAIAFSYCEALLHHGTPAKISEEETRLKSLNNLLASVGNTLDLCEDFVNETLDLVREISSHLSNPLDDSFLVDAFNDVGRSSAIITHVKLLTSSWMKTHAADYEPFLSGQSVAEYCSLQIDPYQVEIEHLGLNALVDVLVKPAGFAVEISYLDRSEGTEMNTHKFEVSDPNAPTLRLLYRPGHYDILYKRANDLNVGLSRFPQSFIPLTTNAVSTSPVGIANWVDLPGSSFASPQPMYIPQTTSVDTQSYSVGTSAVSSDLPNTYNPHGENAPSTLQTRPSIYEQPGYYPSRAVALPFQTPSFKNSHFNPAHYGNKGFQPEMWTPELDSLNRDK